MCRCINNWWICICIFNRICICNSTVCRCINNWWSTQPSNHISGILPCFCSPSCHGLALFACKSKYKYKLKQKQTKHKIVNSSMQLVFDSVVLVLVLAAVLCEVPRSVPMFMMPRVFMLLLFLQIFSSVFANKELLLVYGKLSPVCHNVYETLIFKQIFQNWRSHFLAVKPGNHISPVFLRDGPKMPFLCKWPQTAL